MDSGYLVFKAYNGRLGEVLVAVGRPGFESALRSDVELLPERWHSDDDLRFEVVQRGLTLDEAAKCAWECSESAALAAFRVYVGGLPPGGDRRPSAGA